VKKITTSLPKVIWEEGRVAANRSSDGSRTAAHRRRKVPIGYNGAPQFAPKVPLPVDRYPNPTTCLIPGLVRPMMSNGFRIRSAVLPQCTGQIDAQTDRSSTGKFGH